MVISLEELPVIAGIAFDVAGEVISEQHKSFFKLRDLSTLALVKGSFVTYVSQAPSRYISNDDLEELSKKLFSQAIDDFLYQFPDGLVIRSLLKDLDLDIMGRAVLSRYNSTQSEQIVTLAG